MFWWNRLRDGETGIWSIDPHTLRARLLCRLDKTVAIGWIDSPAAMRDLYAGTGAGDFLRIPLDTLLPIEVLPRPFSTGTVVRCQHSPGTWVCAVAESNADVWLVEPFSRER